MFICITGTCFAVSLLPLPTRTCLDCVKLFLQDNEKLCYCLNDVSRHTAVGCRNDSRDLYTSCGNTFHKTAAVYASGLKGSMCSENVNLHVCLRACM